MNFYDEKGKQIQEFAVLKVFHYIGARRKKEYMYKWVRVIDGHLAAMHLTGEKGSYWLKAVADKDGLIKGTQIVQCYHKDDL